MSKNVSWPASHWEIAVVFYFETRNDLERVQGNYDKLIGLLQEKYGYNKAQAEAEVNRRMNEYQMQQGSRRQSTDYHEGHHTGPAQ